MNVQLNSVSDTRKSLVVTLDPGGRDRELGNGPFGNPALHSLLRLSMKPNDSAGHGDLRLK